MSVVRLHKTNWKEDFQYGITREIHKTISLGNLQTDDTRRGRARSRQFANLESCKFAISNTLFFQREKASSCPNFLRTIVNILPLKIIMNITSRSSGIIFLTFLQERSFFGRSLCSAQSWFFSKLVGWLGHNTFQVNTEFQRYIFPIKALSQYSKHEFSLYFENGGPSVTRIIVARKQTIDII